MNEDQLPHIRFTAPRASAPRASGAWRAWLPGVIFLLGLVLWTWLLLIPNPVPDVIQKFTIDLKFILSKSLHLGAYAVLTVLAGFLPVRRLYFRLLVATLLVHAIGTEIGQTYVSNRSGSVRDVVIDWTGIALGLLALKWLKPAR